MSYHVLNNLIWQLRKQFFGQKIWIHLNFIKGYELDYISCCSDSITVVKSIIAIESVHVAEICISDANDNDGKRQFTVINEKVDGLVHVMDGAIGKDQ